MGVISRPVRAGSVAIMGLAITAFTGTLASAGAATPAPGANLGYVALANSVPPTTDNVTGSYSSPKMQIEVAVAPRDEAGLNTMLAALYDKNSPSYHRWLSTGQFDARYAPTPATQSAVAKYLSTSGLTVVPSGSPFLVRATGSSAQIQRTFHTSLNSFKNPQGTKYFANTTPVYVPSSLSGAAMGVIGLTNTQRNAKNTKNVPHFNNTMRPGAKASATTNCETPYPTVQQLFSHRVDGNPLTLGYGAGPGCSGLTPSQENSLYGAPNLGPRAKGKGVDIAVFELRTPSTAPATRTPRTASAPRSAAASPSPAGSASAGPACPRRWCRRLSPTGTASTGTAPATSTRRCTGSTRSPRRSSSTTSPGQATSPRTTACTRPCADMTRQPGSARSRWHRSLSVPSRNNPPAAGTGSSRPRRPHVRPGRVGHRVDKP